MPLPGKAFVRLNVGTVLHAYTEKSTFEISNHHQLGKHRQASLPLRERDPARCPRRHTSAGVISFLGTALAGLRLASAPGIIPTLAAAPLDKLHNPIIVIIIRRRKVPAGVDDRDGLLIAGQPGHDGVSFLVVDHRVPHPDELAERCVDGRGLIQPVIVAGSSHAACVQYPELERRVLQFLEGLRVWHYRCVLRLL
jgi:hypothetical protein